MSDGCFGDCAAKETGSWVKHSEHNKKLLISLGLFAKHLHADQKS